jgi:hypothetical protein
MLFNFIYFVDLMLNVLIHNLLLKKINKNVEKSNSFFNILKKDKKILF